MKKLIVISILLSFALGAIPAFAVTDYEWDVYWNLVESWHHQVYQQNGDEFEAEGVAIKEIQSKYGFDNDRLWKIIDAVIDEKYVDSEGWIATKHEYDILDDLWKRMGDAGKSASQDEIKRIHREVAGFYGISLFDLHNIEYRVYLDDMMMGWGW